MLSLQNYTGIVGLRVSSVHTLFVWLTKFCNTSTFVGVLITHGQGKIVFLQA